MSVTTQEAAVSTPPEFTSLEEIINIAIFVNNQCVNSYAELTNKISQLSTQANANSSSNHFKLKATRMSSTLLHFNLRMAKLTDRLLDFINEPSTVPEEKILSVIQLAQDNLELVETTINKNNNFDF